MQHLDPKLLTRQAAVLAELAMAMPLDWLAKLEQVVHPLAGPEQQRLAKPQLVQRLLQLAGCFIELAMAELDSVNVLAL